MNSITGSTKFGAECSIYNGNCIDVLKALENEEFNCIVTSPPYFWLRDYGVDGQLGLEESIDEYVENLCLVADELLRVLKKDGVFFLNLGDTYYSGKGESQGVDKKSNKRRFGLRAVDKSGGLGINLKNKTLIGVPWRVSLALISRGWTLRSSIIWYRKSALPESVKDRPRRSYENIFMFVKSKKYFFDRAILSDTEQEDMWTITARPKASKIQTAPFPDELVERCLAIGCPKDGKVLDPFAGSGTTLRVALKTGREATGIELNPEFYSYIVNDLKVVNKEPRCI